MKSCLNRVRIRFKVLVVLVVGEAGSLQTEDESRRKVSKSGGTLGTGGGGGRGAAAL